MTDMSLKEKVAKALEKIGTTNGTAPSNSQDPLDAVIHEYATATLMEGIIKKRRETAKDKMLAAFTVAQKTKTARELDNAKKGLTGTERIADTENFTLSMQTKKGATRVNPDKLRVALLKKFKADVVDALFEEATESNNPSVSWIATEK